MATRLGVEPEFIASDCACVADAAAIEARLAEDKSHSIKRSVWCTTKLPPAPPAASAKCARHRPPAIRAVQWRHHLVARVDAITATTSGRRLHLALAEGLMLPRASFNAVSDKALAARGSQAHAVILVVGRDGSAEQNGFFPYPPSTNLMYGLREALKIWSNEEALDNVFRRHIATPKQHAAPSARGARILFQNPQEYRRAYRGAHSGRPQRSRFPQVVLEHFDMSLGSALARSPTRCSASGTWRLQRPHADGHLCGV